jgi:hypothetical protein
VAVGRDLEIGRPRRLVLTYGMPLFAADFDTAIVEIEPNGGGSVLTIALEGQGYDRDYETSTLNG